MNIKALITTVVSKFGVTGLNAISIVAIAHAFGSTGVGLFALLRTVPLLFTIATDLGLSHSYSYLINVKKFEKHDVLSTQVSIAVLMGVIQCFVWVLSSHSISSLFNFPIDLSNLGLMIPVAATIGIQLHFIGYYRAINEIKKANLISVLTELMITIYVLFLIFQDSDQNGLVNSIAIPYILVSTVLTVESFVGRKYHFCRPNLSIFKVALNFGVKSQIGNAFQLLNYRLDQLVVSFFLGPSSLGVYVIAVKVVEVFRVFSLSIFFVFEPELSKLSEKEALKYLNKHFLKILFANLLVVIVGIIISPVLIPVVFDSWSTDSLTPFYILSLGILVAGGNSFIAAYFLGHGKPMVTTLSITAALLVTFILNLYLVPLYGVDGAAIASSSGYLIVTIVLFYFMNKEIRNHQKMEL